MLRRWPLVAHRLCPRCSLSLPSPRPVISPHSATRVSLPLSALTKWNRRPYTTFEAGAERSGRHSIPSRRSAAELETLLQDPATTFTEAGQAFSDAWYAASSPEEKAFAAHLILDGLLRHRSALHLLPFLQRVVTEAFVTTYDFGESVEDSAERRRWVEEGFDIVEHYATCLVRFNDDRGRKAALFLAEFLVARVESSPDEQSRELAKSRMTGIFRVLCGVLKPLNDRRIALSRAVGYQIHPVQVYSNDFLDEGTCSDFMALISRSRVKGQVLCVLAVTLLHCNFDEDGQKKAESLFDLSQRLRPELGDTDDVQADAYDTVLSRYLRYLLVASQKIRRQNAEQSKLILRRASATYDMQLATRPSLQVSRQLWRQILRHYYSSTLEDLNAVTGLFEGAGQTQVPKKYSRPHSLGHFAQPEGPFPMSVSETFSSWVAGLSRKEVIHRFQIDDVKNAWRKVLDAKQGPDQVAVSSVIRLLMARGMWQDVMRILKHWVMRDNNAGADASLALERCIADLHETGLPVDRQSVIEQDAPQWLVPSANMDVTPHTEWERFPRGLLASAMSRKEPAACYPLWKYGPAICGQSHDAVSLSLLIIAACRLTRLQEGPGNVNEAGQSRSPLAFLWDGMPALLRVIQIFKDLLFAAHPELRTEHTAVKAFKQAVEWNTRGFTQWDPKSRGGTSNLPSSDQRPDTIGHGLASQGRAWTCIAFGQDVFDQYLRALALAQLVYKRRVASRGQRRKQSLQRQPFGVDSDDEVWLEPFEVLSWMRKLNVQPKKSSMAIISIAARQCGTDLDRGASLFSAETPMGPLQEYCEEWIDIEAFPQMQDINRAWTKGFSFARGSWLPPSRRS